MHMMAPTYAHDNADLSSSDLQKLLDKLASAGVKDVQLHEPALVMWDSSKPLAAMYKTAYSAKVTFPTSFVSGAFPHQAISYVKCCHRIAKKEVVMNDIDRPGIDRDGLIVNDISHRINE